MNKQDKHKIKCHFCGKYIPEGKKLTLVQGNFYHPGCHRQLNKDDNPSNMKVVTINIPKMWLELIAILTDSEEGMYPSRSELIRVALRDFLKKELRFFGKVRGKTDKSNILKLDNGKQYDLNKIISMEEYNGGL